MVSVSRGILSKSWCTSRIWGVATIDCNSCDIVTENVKRGVVNELLYADDLVLKSKAM